MSINIATDAGGAASLIEINSATKIFKSNGATFEALRGIDLRISQGDFVSITGESGSGKSTLLSIIGGITPPSKGDVTVDGLRIYTLDSERLADFRREYIGFVFQQFHLIPYLTAIENVMLPLSITAKKDKEGLALEALRGVGIKEKAHRLPSELSGGEQQRAAIARALVNEPRIILADEPTGNLDTKTGSEIFGLFRELNSGGRTVIIVTHNPELASKTRRTVCMKDGMIERIRENAAAL
ncbi:MAG: ABC transporter ATP-binding protein [Thermodesulfovibrionales bacterium]|nr:ABC transporter ATP-binding protein [Thermodesulfovibrionales bacterium]